MPFLGLLSKVCLSYLADRFHGHKIILTASIAAWALGYELMLLIPCPVVLEEEAVILTAHMNHSHNDSQWEEVTRAGVNVDAPLQQHHHARHPLLFLYALACLMVINLAFAPIFSLFDAMSFNVLARSGSKSGFGSIRAWAAAGYMIFSPISGMGMTHLGG